VRDLKGELPGREQDASSNSRSGVSAGGRKMLVAGLGAGCDPKLPRVDPGIQTGGPLIACERSRISRWATIRGRG